MIETAPTGATKRAFKDSVYQQAEEDYLFGSSRQVTSAEDREEIHILLVEDDDVQRSFLIDILEKQGYVVEAVSNGLDASRSIREHGFDLAIVDYKVPEMDGVAVATLVQSYMSQASRPRLLGYTSSLELLNNRIATFGPVFDEIVGKSKNVQDLLSSIDGLLKSSPNPTTRRLASAGH